MDGLLPHFKKAITDKTYMKEPVQKDILVLYNAAFPVKVEKEKKPTT